METIYTLNDFMISTKSVIYLLMGGGLIGLGLWWKFLTARDDKPRYF